MLTWDQGRLNCILKEASLLEDCEGALAGPGVDLGREHVRGGLRKSRDGRRREGRGRGAEGVVALGGDWDREGGLGDGWWAG